MAAWIEELFPAKYKIEDLLDDIGIAVGEEKSSRSQKTYEDNFHSYLLKYETDRSKGNVKFKIENKNEKKECKTEEVQPSFGEGSYGRTNDGHSREESKNDQNGNTTKEIQGGCPWNLKELNFLRQSLECSKLNTIRLSVLSRALQKDCERVKDNCRDQEKQLLELRRKYGDVLKQNKALKITCKAFKDDSKHAHMQLENCRRQLEDARKDIVVAENEVMEMKQKIDRQNQQNSPSLEKTNTLTFIF
ncbi:uncharacterized protein LOC124446571 isoform X2 [Xenia sp. Carnegie-2017]|uniref:uncharacterized protein LOC124446571 isoform X2 n=1 Tax=Xenia sp. Carnegie-2017 TaxID=2897299 RepID=UPI001F044AC1|nr:uncharacterized protein LOC124446571 isoform X2 [Xenia sp. Carnegie-2017]